MSRSQAFDELPARKQLIMLKYLHDSPRYRDTEETVYLHPLSTNKEGHVEWDSVD